MSNGQTVNLVPKVFSDPPTGYIEIEKIKSSKTWIAPEDGFFQFIALAASGDGGYCDSAMHGEQELAGGGSGGSGGIVVSNFTLNKGDSVNLSVGGSASISQGGKKQLQHQVEKVQTVMLDILQ